MNRPTRAALLLGPVLLASLACGVPDKSLGDTAGSLDDTAETPGDSDTSAEGSCQDLEDDLEPGAVKTVRVINSTAGPLWLPAAPCGGLGEAFTRFRMTVDGVEAVDVAPGCARCTALEVFCPSVDAPNCCEGFGQCEGTVRIGPGESFDLNWSTSVYTKATIAEGCGAVPCEPEAQCRVRRVVEAGSMVEMRLQAVTECNDFPDEMSCGECPAGQTCKLGLSSACEFAMTKIEAEVAFELSLDDAVIELEFN